VRDGIMKKEQSSMGTATQLFWLGSSGGLLVPRSGGTTANPLTLIGMTGGFYTARSPLPIVPPEEEEWASLAAAERKALAKRRVKPRDVGKAIKEVRYRK